MNNTKISSIGNRLPTGTSLVSVSRMLVDALLDHEDSHALPLGMYIARRLTRADDRVMLNLQEAGRILRCKAVNLSKCLTSMRDAKIFVVHKNSGRLYASVHERLLPQTVNAATTGNNLPAETVVISSSKATPTTKHPRDLSPYLSPGDAPIKERLTDAVVTDPEIALALVNAVRLSKEQSPLPTLPERINRKSIVALGEQLKRNHTTAAMLYRVTAHLNTIAEERGQKPNVTTLSCVYTEAFSRAAASLDLMRKEQRERKEAEQREAAAQAAIEDAKIMVDCLDYNIRPEKLTWVMCQAAYARMTADKIDDTVRMEALHLCTKVPHVIDGKCAKGELAEYLRVTTLLQDYKDYFITKDTGGEPKTAAPTYDTNDPHILRQNTLLNNVFGIAQ